MHAYPHLMDDVRVEPGYKSYNAVIPDPESPSGTFTIGCNGTPEQAAQRAAWHLLDQQGIPHVHSARSLKLKELREMSAADLRAREQQVKYKRGNAASGELARIHRVMNERNRIADEMLANAKQAQAQLMEQTA